MFKPIFLIVSFFMAFTPLRASEYPALLEGSPDELKNPYTTICETPDLFYNEESVKDMLSKLLTHEEVNSFKEACQGKNTTVLELLFLCKGPEVEDQKPFKTDVMLKTLTRLFWNMNKNQLSAKIYGLLYELSDIQPKKTVVSGKRFNEPGVADRRGGNMSHYVVFSLSEKAEANPVARAAMRQLALNGQNFGDPAHEIGKTPDLQKEARDRLLRFMTGAEKKNYEKMQGELMAYRKRK